MLNTIMLNTISHVSCIVIQIFKNPDKPNYSETFLNLSTLKRIDLASKKTFNTHNIDFVGINLPIKCLVSFIILGHRCRSDTAKCSVWSGFSLTAYRNFNWEWNRNERKMPDSPKIGNGLVQLIHIEKFIWHIWVNMEYLGKHHKNS